MRNVPAQLAHDLRRLRDDSHIPLPADRISEGRAEIEELISKAIHLYGRLNRQHERWATPLRQSGHPFNLEEGKLWQTTFQEWCDDAREIIRQAKAFEVSGQSVDQLDTLRSTLMHCDYDGIDIERLIASASNLAEGKGIPATEIKDESYNADYDPTAKNKLLELPASLAWRVREAIDEHLCAAPASLSRPSHFPHPPQFQLYETWLDEGDRRYFLKVFFHYSQDEQLLLIDDFVLMPLD